MRRLVGLVERMRAALRRRMLQGSIRVPHALAALGILLVVGALAADSLAPGPGPAPSSVPGPSGRPSGESSASPTSEPWSDLRLPTYEQLADLAPSKSDTSGVGLTSQFILTSRTSTPALALAAGLQAEPPFAFTARPGASAAEALIVPTSALAEGTRYRFRVADPTGRLVGTWSYRTEQPLHIVSSLPGDLSTNVPTDTGIEITFDQDGATNLPAYFSIEPAVAGTFQTVGRTVVFSPTKPLAAATAYRVTVRPGVPMAGSSQALETGSTWTFETSGPTVHEAFSVVMGKRIYETPPGQPAIIGLALSFDQSSPRPASIPLQAYRLPSEGAARDAAGLVLVDTGWEAYDGSGLVATTGLTKVVDIAAVPETMSDDGLAVVRLPAPLPVGWYLIVIPRDGRDRQAILQVTDLAAWAMTSETRTVAWVHDITTGDPIPGAGLFDPSGTRVGVTGPSGMLDIPTPAGLEAQGSNQYAAAAATLATVVAPDGRRLMVALGAEGSGISYQAERNGAPSASPADRWWLLLSTDRTAYRPTDTIHAWGLIRSRDDGTVPGSIEIRLRTADASDTGPWLVQTVATPTARGTWATDLSLSDMPYGDYIVDVAVDGTETAATWVQVQDIRKPAYQLDLRPDRTAVIAGDTVHVTTTAHFFDGTASAGLQLKVSAFDRATSTVTDAAGVAAVTLTAASTPDSSFDFGSVSAVPANPEEGQISGSANVVVFPSAAWLDQEATVIGSSVTLSGHVSHVDLAAVERQVSDAGWPDDPAGAPWPGRAISVTVVEQVPVTRQTGTTYDYIDKRVVPVFETTEHDVAVGTFKTTSSADGSYGLTIAIPDADHGYSLKMTSRDDAGRVVTTTTYAARAEALPAGTPLVRPYLDHAASCGAIQKTVTLGQPFDLTMHDGDGAVSSAGQYLFLVASRGIREVVLQDSPTLSRTFAAAELPSLNVVAVRFGPGGYVVTNEVLVRPEPAARTLTVALTSDRPRYAPGASATVSITTTAPDGSPVAADVVVRGVDEKLYAGGTALDAASLETLLQPVGDGILQSAATHELPLPTAGEGCGDTAGGGRDDFRDSVLFRLVSTGPDGKASVTFPLADDITSWRIGATALDGELRAGDASVLLPVGLPFFADAIVAPEFVTGEQPILQVRSAGDALVAGERVRYTVSAPSLGMAATTNEADASATASVALPSVSPGVHAITIDAVVLGHPELHDRLTRSITVRGSRVEIARSAVVDPADVPGTGGAALTTFLVTDAGRGSLLPVLNELSEGTGARFDRALAAAVARDLLVSTYGVDPATLPAPAFDVSHWQRDGIALLPYSTTDLELTSLAAIVAPERLDQNRARAALTAWLDDPDVTRERRIVGLAGEAALGADVVDELAIFDRPGLTVRESLWLGLAYLASGDEGTARTIERGLLDAYGQQLGPWVRLDVGRQLVDTVEASSLLALLAAGLGDSLATSVLAYVEETPTATFLPSLHEIGTIRFLLERLPRDTARFAWTVDGSRHEETLAAGTARTITVTAAQRAGLTIQPEIGAISVVARWSGAAGVGDLPSGDLVTIKRTVSPAGGSGRTDIVHVTLELQFAALAPTGCYDVTDRAPSGLAPLVAAPGWDDSEAPSKGIRPWAVNGQQVSWCVDAHGKTQPVLTYSARVVSPGSYTWEPAVVQSAIAPTVGAFTPVTTYTVR